MSRDRRCGHHAAETPLHACTVVRVPTYNSVRKVKKVFLVILIPKLSLNFVVALAAVVKSKPSSKERFFLGTANPKRAAAHGRLGPERAVAAYTRTTERERAILIGWHSDIGRDQA